MPARYDDWMRQAKRDLEHARHALENAEYEWASFAAQQSAEKAVKALFLRANRSAWGHSVNRARFWTRKDADERGQSIF